MLLWLGFRHQNDLVSVRKRSCLLLKVYLLCSPTAQLERSPEVSTTTSSFLSQTDVPATPSGDMPANVKTQSGPPDVETLNMDRY